MVSLLSLSAESSDTICMVVSLSPVVITGGLTLAVFHVPGLLLNSKKIEQVVAVEPVLIGKDFLPFVRGMGAPSPEPKNVPP